jgi:hypothetical protein
MSKGHTLNELCGGRKERLKALIAKNPAWEAALPFNVPGGVFVDKFNHVFGTNMVSGGDPVLVALDKMIAVVQRALYSH